MSARKTVAERYFDGFRRSDHALILSCLTDDVVWQIHGHVTLQGKAAFDGEIENPAFDGQPLLDVHRVIEEGDVVATTGRGRAMFRDGGEFIFDFATFLTFADDLIRRVDSYVVPIGGES